MCSIGTARMQFWSRTAARARTFIDGRCDPFPLSVWNDYLAVERVSPRWLHVLDRYGANAVLVKNGRPSSHVHRRTMRSVPAECVERLPRGGTRFTALAACARSVRRECSFGQERPPELARSSTDDAIRSR